MEYSMKVQSLIMKEAMNTSNLANHIYWKYTGIIMKYAMKAPESLMKYSMKVDSINYERGHEYT